MKASKRIFALMVFCLMIFNTVSAFAADRDVWEKATETKFATRMEMRTDKAKILKVRQKPNDYYFEANGHLFDMKTMYEEFAKDKLNFVAQLVPAKAVKPVEEGLKVASVSAINAKTLKVTFSQAVKKEDQAKVKFDVKKDSIVVAVTAKWAEDGMSVELAKATKLSVGKHTVKVSGIKFVPNGDMGSVEVKAEEATAVVIKSESLDMAANAPFIFEVHNQYSEAIKPRPAVSVAALNKTEAGRVVIYNPGAPDVLDTSATIFGDEVQLTVFVADKPEVKIVKTLKVTGQVIDKIEFGEAKLEDGQTALYPGKKIMVPVKAFVGPNPMKLTAPAHTNGTATVDGLIPSWNTDDLSAVAFVVAKQELTLTVKADATAGEKTFNYVMANGDIASFKFTVVANPVPASLEVKKVASEQLGAGKSTTIAFKVMMSDGTEAKGTDLNGYKVKVSKKSKANNILTAPNHATPLPTIDNADILNPQPITAAAGGAGKTETITYQLLDKDGKDLGAAVTVDVEVVAALDGIDVKADKAEYVSGEDIVLTVQAQAGGDDVDYTMEFKNAKVTVGTTAPKTYFRDVNFVGGVAKVTVPATVVIGSAELVEVDLLNDTTIVNAGAPTIKVKAGEVSKFKVETGSDDKKITITAQDKNGNTVEAFVGKKVITVMAEDKDGNAVTLDQLNAENQIEATFTAGVQTDLAVHSANIAADTKVKVVFGSISGEYTK